MTRGRPKGRKDNPSNKRPKRAESESQKRARLQKMSATRKKNNADNLAAKPSNANAVSMICDDRLNNQATPNQPALSNTNTKPKDSTADGGDGDPAVIDSEAVEVRPASNVTANLDVEDDDDIPHSCDDYEEDEHAKSTTDVEELSVQQQYVKAIQLRLREEVKQNTKTTDLYLLNHLKKNNWWIRKEHAHYFVKKLGLKKEYAAFYRDVYIWLPDIRWTDVNCKPCCPTCKSNDNVGSNGFHDKHPGRLVVGLEENYNVITRRYCCYQCKAKSKEVKSVVDQAFEGNDDVTVEKTVDKYQHNFMGWNKTALPLFPFGRGEEFPAILTWKAGVDKTVNAMMRPLFDKGLKPESFSNTLLELHTAKFAKLSVRHEYEIKAKRKDRLDFVTDNMEPLGDFADKTRYAGSVPTGRYLMLVYVSFHASIRPYLEREVKKRDMDVLMVDVSYKEAKSLYQYHGKSVFRGLVTGLNQYGEVRLQFHIYTDSHEQMLSALEAFEKTRLLLGFGGVSHIIGDNPKKEASLYMSAMPSVREQQAKYDSLKLPAVRDPLTGAKYYDPKNLLIKVAHGTAEMNRCVIAMRQEMKGKAIGLDAEWNRNLNSLGHQTGNSKLKWIQIAYRNESNALQVLLFWVGDLKALPSNLRSLFCDSSIQFVGNKVSGDLKKIGRDFKVEPMNAEQQKLRKNVINLGMHARVRGVINNANVSLDKLAQLTLELSLDKSLQTSTWTKTLTNDQKMYAAIDAAASLEVYEKLEQMKDLSSRLCEDDAVIGTIVDLVPTNGNPMSMATRAATGEIVGVKEYICPVGYKYNNQRYVKMGKRTYVVKIKKIHAPGLVIPRYRYKNMKSTVTLADLGEVEIVVPLGMLSEHVEGAHENNPPAMNTSTESNVTSPSTTIDCLPRRSDRGQIPRRRLEIEGYDTNEDGDEEEKSEWQELEEEIDNYKQGLNHEDIELLRAAIFESTETGKGAKVPLQCNGLDDPPAPELIQDKYSAVLGDVFHAMDRTKVPIKHDAKKSYFVALREAFLIWNPTKMAELEKRMRESGMTDDEIKEKKYFNARLFRECVERTVPSPKILYWRVRAVYAIYGNRIDSKTNQPLFNKATWLKANNLLKEILCGYYSDPPDLDFYTKKLGRRGEVITNQYGFDVIECFRGTNRTEAFHKNLTVTFGRWHVGIQMSDALLGERRHRHNLKCSEKRRLGYPKIGHADTWVVDQLQNLVRENHGIQIYPHWSNASDYTSTDESFDTIALHTQTLHDVLEQRSREIGPVKLTQEQSYIRDRMNTSLPFLPFVSKEECMAYAKFVLDRDEADVSDYHKAAEMWMKYVDGDKIWPKLPSQMRIHDETWSRNRRIKESEEKAGDGRKTLDKLNATIIPAKDDGAVNTAVWKEAKMPSPMPEPPSQAWRKAPFLIIGGLLVGDNPSDNNKPAPPKRKNRHRLCGMIGCPGLGGDVHCPKYKASLGRKNEIVPPTKKRQCKVCRIHGPKGLRLNCVTGSGNQSSCKYFFIRGGKKCRLCQTYDANGPDCMAGLNQTACKHFEPNGTQKQKVQA